MSLNQSFDKTIPQLPIAFQSVRDFRSKELYLRIQDDLQEIADKASPDA